MSGLRELPGYQHRARPDHVPWREGDDGMYLERMRAVWGSEECRRGREMRYSLYFDSKLSGFGEAVMAIGPLLLRDIAFKIDVERGHYGIAFTTDFQTWQNALSALKSCPVANLKTYQNELQDGGG